MAYLNAEHKKRCENVFQWFVFQYIHTESETVSWTGILQKHWHALTTVFADFPKNLKNWFTLQLKQIHRKRFGQCKRRVLKCVCPFVQFSEMAEKKALSVGNGQSTVAQSAQGGLVAPSAGMHGALQDGLSFTPLDSNTDGVVQPFPRSPKLQRKVADAGQPSQVLLPSHHSSWP